VGVFVNSTIAEIEEKAVAFELDLIQLHGDESVSFVKELSLKGFRIIKVFGVMDKLPIDEMKAYEPFMEYFLFDTKTSDYGGSGRKFEWEILKTYSLNKPFFVSGGIDLEDIETIKSMDLKMLHAIDVNSRFELAPGVKDIDKIRKLKELL
jgi:phosphoribosylanthranilate isomerase